MLKTLKGRTAFAAALLAGVGIALVTTLQSDLSQRTVITSTVAQHQTSVARTASDLDVRLRRAKGAISEFASNIPGAQLDDHAVLQNYLSARIGTQQSFESVAVYRQDGRLLASRPLQSPTSVAGEGWFQTAVKKGNVIGEPIRSRLSGDPVIPLAYGVYDEDGKFRGVAVGMLQVSHDNLVSFGTADENRAHFIVVARSGRIVLHSQTRLIGRSVELLGNAQAAAIERAMADPSATVEGGADGGQRSLYAASPLPSAGWFLVGIVSNDEAYASLHRLSRHMLLAGGVLAVLLFPAMWLLVGVMLKPLDTLRREMRRVKQGAEHVPQAVMAAGTLEIRQVALEFEDMAAARREAEQALQQEKERAEVTLQSIGDAVVATDVLGRITAFNVAAEKLAGCSAADAIGRSFADVVRLCDEVTGERLPDPVVQAIAESAPTSTTHAVLHRKNGRIVPIDNSVSPIHGPGGSVEGAVVVFRDVADARAAAQELSWRASHDAMTGLANRAAYEVALNDMFETTRNGSEHSVLMIDLDEFKIVNDTCGHAAGDELLKQLAALFLRVARKSDLVARLGGDEFAVLMYQCSSDHALRVAEKLREAVADWRFVWEGQTFRVGASIGIVLADRSFASAADVQKAADMACYMAKRTGRNRISVHTSDDSAVESMRTQMQLVSRVQEAIDDGRLVLYAQTIAPGTPAQDDGAHFEVLVRMMGEDGNLIPPGEFLGAAERYGLMDQLDRWVLDHAMAACAGRFGPDRWHELDMVAVNISATTFRDPAIVDYVAAALARHGMPPGCLCLEMTETAAVQGLQELRELLTRMRALGVKIALDDFGVGMTSLSHLRDISVDLLKFDRSFTTSIDRDPVNSEMVDAVLRIACRLGMRAVAEGVETQAELAHLQRLGVHYLQGFLLARPAPIDEVLARVARTPAATATVAV